MKMDGDDDDPSETCSIFSTGGPGHNVLNNDLLLSLILSKCSSRGLKTLRLVHPRWNDALLSSVVDKPRLWSKLPLLWTSDEEGGGDPLERIKRIDPRLVRKLELKEDYMDPGPGMPCSLLQWSTFFQGFGPSIQSLSLTVGRMDTLKTSVVLAWTSCPHLKELELAVELGDEARSLMDGQAVSDQVLQPKPTLQAFKFIDVDVYNPANARADKPAYLRTVQIILKASPNLQRLNLQTNFLPTLDNQKDLKSLTWTILILPDKFAHEQDHSILSNPALCYRNFRDSLEPSAKTLETLVIHFSGLQGNCVKCQELIAAKHFPPLVLPRLKKLIIHNPMVIMMEGGLGFKQFSQAKLPSLDTLEFRGSSNLCYHLSFNFKNLQARLQEFLQEEGNNCVISIYTLDLGYIQPQNNVGLTLSPSSWPNLTSLKFCVDPSDHFTSVLHDSDITSTFNFCNAIANLQELNIQLKWCILDSICELLSRLRTSGLFNSNALRKLTIDLEGRGSGTQCEAEDYQEYANELTKCVLQTKNMQQVIFLNFSIPPTVFIPLFKLIQDMKLPVSFGELVETSI